MISKKSACACAPYTQNLILYSLAMIHVTGDVGLLKCMYRVISNECSVNVYLRRGSGEYTNNNLVKFLCSFLFFKDEHLKKRMGLYLEIYT
jgi:hypothetical protein